MFWTQSSFLFAFPWQFWKLCPVHSYTSDLVCNLIYLAHAVRFRRRPSRPRSYGSWIYKLKLWVRTPFRWSVLDTTLCDKICRWLAAGRWFSPGIPVYSTNKTDLHDVTEILLKVALNTITLSIALLDS